MKSREAHRPIASLLSKSEKALKKMPPGSWQQAMLRDNIRALHVATSLLHRDTKAPVSFSRDDLRQALRALATMIGKTAEALQKFSPGTSQHSLLRNRLAALRTAKTLTTAEL